MKTWLKIILTVEPMLVEPLSDFLIGVIGSGVEVNADEISSRQIITVYVAKENPSPEEIRQITAHIVDYGQELADILKTAKPELDHEIIGEQDWGEEWKKHFSPYHLTPHLIVAPTWERYEVHGSEKLMIMDPGMAFGTGHHATTALVATLLEEEILTNGNNHSVLDVGTGTGVLGMAAALFGAQDVIGIDNDPLAVQIAGENVKKNTLQGRMRVSEEPITQLNGSYSLVVANIIHDVLLSMSGELQRLTSRGGKLILSGLLAGEQVESVRATFEKEGFSFEQECIREEWSALLMKKE